MLCTSNCLQCLKRSQLDDCLCGVCTDYREGGGGGGGGVTSVYVRLSHRIQKGQDIGGHRRT